MWDGGRGWLFVVTTFLAFLLGETFGPAYATRYCIGKDVAETKKGIAGVGFALSFTFPVFILIIAIYGRLAFPEVESQQALAEVVKYLNNPVFGGLMIAALLSAVMSSADSALNSATTIFTKDLFEHQLRWRDRSDKFILKLARILTVILGVVSTLIAILFPDIIGLLLFTYQIWAPAIILPICIGALSSERSELQNANVFWTMLLATGVTLVYAYLPNEQLKEIVDQFEPAVFGVCASLVIYFLIWVIQKLTGMRGPQPSNA
jgi:SSS family solute:Na+ symporter